MDARSAPDGWECATPTIEKLIGSLFVGKLENLLPWVANGGM